MTSLASGSQIGGYEIVAPLRSGGMASFYLARRVGPAGFTRPIGIKVVHAHLAGDRSFVDMFLDEARLSARIVHPNVVHVEELGESEGMFFLAMELVHGAPLSALLRRLSETGKVLTVPVACAIAMRVADGLHAAHEVKDDAGVSLEVVHRDVSPQNILVGADGRVKLIDFGIAKARGRLQETEGGSLKGKLRYMSPEQAWGRPIDRRTDIYALGIVLWESLTGRRLFGGETDIDALERVRAPEIPDPSELEDSVPPSLDAALRTALARDPADRFDTAQAFRKALGNACPEAAKVEPDEIGALVRTLLPDDLDRERALLGSFSGALPEPRKDDAERASHTLHDTRQTLTDEPAAAIAPTRVVAAASASVAAPARRSSWSYVLAALAVVAISAGAYVAWPSPPAGPCDGIVAIPPGDGSRVVIPFDTRGGTLDFELREMRNPAAPATPSAAFSYIVPGTGVRTVEIDTAIEPTNRHFDTMIAIFRGACTPAMTRHEADVELDDDELHNEYRARGEVRALGGETLTIVISSYGGAVGDRLDDGQGALSILTRDSTGPSLRTALVRLDGAQLHVEIAGDDADGDVVTARLRFAARDGAPIATVPLGDMVRPPGPFTAEATIDVGPEGQRTIGTARTVEVSLIDRAGNASEPVEIDVTPSLAPDAGT